MLNNALGFIVFCDCPLGYAGTDFHYNVSDLNCTFFFFVAASPELCKLIGNIHRNPCSLCFMEMQSQNFLQGLAHQV